MTTTSEILAKVEEQHPIVLQQIAEIEAELASETPRVTAGPRVMFEGEEAKAMLKTLLSSLKACDELYKLAKAELSN